MISEIIKLNNPWQHAIKRKDAEALRELAADAKEGFVAHIMESQNNITAVTSTDVAVRVHGAMAVVACAVRRAPGLSAGW